MLRAGHKHEERIATKAEVDTVPYMSYDTNDPNSHDVTQTDVTMDGNWYELDMDTYKTVPTGAIGMYVKCYYSDNTVGASVSIRDTGQSNTKQTVWLTVLVANQYHSHHIFIPLDSDNKFDYNFSEAFTAWGFTVLWWVYPKGV